MNDVSGVYQEIKSDTMTVDCGTFHADDTISDANKIDPDEYVIKHKGLTVFYARWDYSITDGGGGGRSTSSGSAHLLQVTWHDYYTVGSATNTLWGYTELSFNTGGSVSGESLSATTSKVKVNFGRLVKGGQNRHGYNLFGWSGATS